MDFIIAYYVKLIINILTFHNNTLARSIKTLCVLLCLTFSSASLSYERGHTSGDAYQAFKLSTQIKDAVDNGIELSFDCKFKVNKQVGFISWPKKQREHLFSLTYHALSNLYLVRINESNIPENFHSIGEATNYIMEKSDTFFTQYSNNKRNTQMRLSLNKFKLPGPIRLSAFTAPHWDIDTGWIPWSPEN